MTMMSRTVLAVLCLAFAACSGGGGGGSSGGGGGGSTSAGGFTLSGTSAAFTLLEGEAAPPSQSLQLNVTGSKVAYVGAAYTGGATQPSWLSINITGSGTAYNVVLSIYPFGLTAGSYSSVFSVGTADADGNVLQSKTITVTVTVSARMKVTGADATFTFMYGDGTTTQAVAFDVTAPGKQWHVTSDAAWLQVPATKQSGSATVNATIDVPSLAPGAYNGLLTMTNDVNAKDTVSRVVSVTISSPTFTVDQESILLGGESGTALEPQALNLALNTGTVAYPFTVETKTDSGGNWLQSSAASGSVGAAGNAIQLSAAPGTLKGGTYTGEVTVTATVRDLVFAKKIPVTFNLEASRIVVGAAGVMLSSSPSPARSVLSRDVTVWSSIGSTNVAWSASSDQSWLSVTQSGVTGGAIHLSADPSGLTQNTTHYATVTVTSSDARVENQQSIRVGLYINSAAPVDFSNHDATQFQVASPVEPIVFVNGGGADIKGYDVFTGTVVRTFAGAVATAGVMVMSDDGQRLFVYDTTNLRVTELNAVTGAFVHNYESGTYHNAYSTTTPAGGGLAYFRPDGYEVLVTPSSRTYDLSSGAELDVQPFYAPVNSLSLRSSSDQRFLVTDYGSVYRMKRTSLHGGGMDATQFAYAGTVEGREGEACISADGSRIYTASGAPYNFPASSMSTGEVVQVLPGDAYPNSIQCLWNGVIIGGIDGYYETYDIWIYNGPTGQLLGHVSSTAGTGAYRSLNERGIAVSGDGTRMITLAGAGPYNDSPEMRVQSIPGLP